MVILVSVKKISLRAHFNFCRRMLRSNSSVTRRKPKTQSSIDDNTDANIRPCRLSPRSKKRKVRKISVLDSELPTSSKDPPLSDQFIINDNVTTTPLGKRRQGKVAEQVGSSPKFTCPSSKKVSFNDVVDSRFISEEQTFLKRKLCNQSLPKSILKQTGYVARKSKWKKKKIRKPVIRKINSEISELGTSKQRRAFVYLDNWKHCKVNWKFEKVIQTWLLKNMFDSSIMPKEKFELLLEYMTEMRGAAVLLARRLSTEMIQHSEATPENEEEDVTQQASFRRAKLVLQRLQE